MKAQNNQSKTGVWILGACGDIASTLIVGTLAIRKGISSSTGLVSEITPMSELDLASLDSLVFGGQDISSQSLSNSVEEVYRRSRTFSREILDEVLSDIEQINDEIIDDKQLAWNVNQPQPGGAPLSELAVKQREILQAFKTKHDLKHVVVVNLTSAEPLPPPTKERDTLSGFEQLIADNRKDLVSPSMLYAYAAFKEGCSHINFTPNPAASVPALEQLAQQSGMPLCGNDGKTGETLVKTALAPMFAQRHLRVMSWEGLNLLGNGDGKTLDNPENKKAKLQNKAQVLDNMLGYPVHSGVGINYVPSLGDWKTAWDLIHFQGFLDVPMTMQFTWQGCDSILAAPLVLDMIRFSEFAARHQEAGPMRHMACFFKNPIGVDEMALYPQFELLLKYTQKHLAIRNKQSSLRVLK